MPAIQVRGIPGSGKSWLSRKIIEEGIECYDTDDVIHDTFYRLFKKPEFRQLIRESNLAAINLVNKTSKRALLRKINLANLNNKFIVIVGVTLDFKKVVDNCYFIKMSARALRLSYRRVMNREIQKITDNHQEISNIISEEDIDMNGVMLNFKINQSLELTMTFKYYKNTYKGALQFETQRGIQALNQSDILKTILSMKSQ